MCIVTAGDFQRNSGQYQDRALVEPVIITRNGRERTVLISADEYTVGSSGGDREVRHTRLMISRMRMWSAIRKAEPGRRRKLRAFDHEVIG